MFAKLVETLPNISRLSVLLNCKTGVTKASDAVVYVIAINATSRAKMPSFVEAKPYFTDSQWLIIVPTRIEELACLFQV